MNNINNINNINNSKQLFVRRPQCISSSQQKKQNKSPLKKCDRFYRKPQTTTYLPSYIRSPMKTNNHEEIVKTKGSNEQQFQQILNCNQNNQSLQQQEKENQKEEQFTIFAHLKGDNEQKQKNSSIHQSVSSNNTSEQYSMIDADEQFLTSFNQRFFANNQCEEQSKDSKATNEMQFQDKQQSQQDHHQIYEYFDAKKYKAKSKKNIEQQNKAQQNKTVHQHRYQNQTQTQNSTQHSKNNKITSLRQPNSKKDIIECSSYQLQSQKPQTLERQKQYQRCELTYSNSYNPVIKSHKKDSLMGIQEEPSDLEESGFLHSLHEDSQVGQVEEQKEQQLLKLQQKLNPTLIQENNISELLKNHINTFAHNIDNIPSTKPLTIMDSFGLPLQNQPLNYQLQTNHLTSRQHQINQITQLLQHTYNNQFHSIHYDDRSEERQQESCSNEDQVHLTDKEKSDNSVEDFQVYDDSEIETSRSIYTMTQCNTSDKGQEEDDERQSIINNASPFAHSNFLYNNMSNKDYESYSEKENSQLSSQSYIHTSMSNNIKNNKQQQHRISYKYKNKQNIPKQKMNSFKKIKIDPINDQFYNKHMNKLDILIVDILQMKKDFQQYYLNSIRQQKNKFQKNNSQILNQIKEIKKKLNIKQTSDRNIQVQQNKRKRSHKGKNLIKYTQKHYYPEESILDLNKQYQTNNSPIITFQNSLIHQSLNLYEKQYQHSSKNQYQEHRLQSAKQQSKPIPLPVPKSIQAHVLRVSKRHNSLNLSCKKSKQRTSIEAKYNHQIQQQSSEKGSSQNEQKANDKSIDQNKYKCNSNSKGENNVMNLQFSHKNRKNRQRKDNETRQYSQNLINLLEESKYKQKQKSKQNQVQRQRDEQIHQINENDKYTKQEEHFYGWQAENEGCLSDNSQNSDIQENNIPSQLKQSNQMLSSIPYITKVISSKKQLKLAIKQMKSSIRSFDNQSSQVQINIKGHEKKIQNQQDENIVQKGNNQYGYLAKQKLQDKNQVFTAQCAEMKNSFWNSEIHTLKLREENISNTPIQSHRNNCDQTIPISIDEKQQTKLINKQAESLPGKTISFNKKLKQGRYQQSQTKNTHQNQYHTVNVTSSQQTTLNILDTDDDINFLSVQQQNPNQVLSQKDKLCENKENNVINDYKSCSAYFQVNNQNIINKDFKENKDNQCVKYSTADDEYHVDDVFYYKDTSIQILPHSSIFNSIYYERHDKEMYNYKWFKFK